MTDFSPARPASWPSIDADHFVVHEIGDTWAVVTEGTASAWERARYEWDSDGDRVVIVTQDSKLFGPGGGWVFRLTPEGSGTRVEVELTRAPKAFTSAGSRGSKRPCLKLVFGKIVESQNPVWLA